VREAPAASGHQGAVILKGTTMTPQASSHCVLHWARAVTVSGGVRARNSWCRVMQCGHTLVPQSGWARATKTSALAAASAEKNRGASAVAGDAKTSKEVVATKLSTTPPGVCGAQR
jgi:phosphoribosylformimino-5-aminoimidazole carboxamide ribonucleotide (ProFAR) isomerase